MSLSSIFKGLIIFCLIFILWTIVYFYFNDTKQSSYIGRKIRKYPYVKIKENGNIKIIDHNTTLTFDDIFISVKTSKKFHYNRLSVILSTWFNFVRNNTYFFTDEDDAVISKATHNHLINSKCSPNHTRQSLCCKMSAEYDYFLKLHKKWFCHFDDDTYVNVHSLLKLLKKYNTAKDWYLGTPSLLTPLEIQYTDNIRLLKKKFNFATGGAGFCLSHSTTLKMFPYAGKGKLKTLCDTVHLPDDCTIGFIIYHYIKINLTVIDKFHSHLESLSKIKSSDLASHITFSYSLGGQPNRVLINSGKFNSSYDPTRFLTIHCKLYPFLDECL